jgi:two-component system, NtrC family, sensor histidine kinase PilS
MVKINTDYYGGREILPSLQLLMFLRIAFVSILLGATVIIQVRETKAYFGETLNALYFLIAIIYFLTFLYAISLNRVKDLIKFTYLQILLDTLFITAIIYTTGGLESIFSFLYILNIISGGTLLYLRGGITVASFSSILYGSLLVLSYFGFISPMNYKGLYTQRHLINEIIYRVLVNTTAFYLVAFLSSFLSEQIRRGKNELKASQKDIANLEMLKENIIQSVSSALIAVDENSKVILFNKGAETLFDINSEDAILQPIAHVMPFLIPYLSQNRPNDFSQISYKGTDGTPIELLLNVSPLKGQSDIKKGKIFVFQDTTRLNEMERDIKRMENLAMIGELAARIAHEIRNPLASISGSIQLLNISKPNDNSKINKKLMDIVLREIDRLNHLIEDFLQFARPQRKELEKFSLNQLILDTLQLFKNSQKMIQQLDIETKFFSELEIISDSQQIKQVLWNIFLNAYEAMPNGGLIRVTTDTINQTNLNGESRYSAKITVEDTGPGIQSKLMKDMFKPFSTTKEGGSGLGLAIVKKIIDSLNGKVYSQNLPTRGAAITIMLPFSISTTNDSGG